MTNRADALRQQLRDKVEARNLDQICTELQMIEQQGYTAAHGVVTAAYHRSLEERFPELCDRAWEIDAAHELANPDEFTPFITSLLEARKELGI